MKKKNNYNEQLLNQDDSYRISTIIIIILIIVFILIAFYFLTKFVLKNKQNDVEIAESVIQNDKIIFGQLLDKNEDEYYVIAYDKNSKFKEIYDKYIAEYKQKDDSLNVYEIDLSDGFNKKFVTDETNITDDIDSLTVSDEVLFKIRNGKIEKYYVGSADINNALKEISE